MQTTQIQQRKNDTGEVEGTSQDAEQAAEELGDPLPGLLSPHFAAQQCFPGMHSGNAAHH
jgi:hypothetical protein